MFQSADTFEAGLKIEKNMMTAKLQLMRLLFDDIKQEMNHIAPVYGLELEEKSHYYLYQEKCNERFYKGDTTSPGINYRVKKAKLKNDYQLWFRNQIDEFLFAGFMVFDPNAESGDGISKGWEVSHLDDGLLQEISAYLDKQIFYPQGWLITANYANGKLLDLFQCVNYDDVPNFKPVNDYAIRLVDEEKRKAFAKQTVRIFEKQLLKYLL